MESTKGWKIVKYNQQVSAGPADAIKAVCKELDTKGISYTLEDFNEPSDLPEEKPVRKLKDKK